MVAKVKNYVRLVIDYRACGPINMPRVNPWSDLSVRDDKYALHISLCATGTVPGLHIGFGDPIVKFLAVEVVERCFPGPVMQPGGL
jgi:hypothetical protein